MQQPIFCPSLHLVLGSPKCSICGWEYQQKPGKGMSAWSSIQLDAGLSNPKKDAITHPVANNGVLAIPLSNQQIVGLDTQTGQKRWSVTLSEGQSAYQIVTDGERFLLSINDDRPIGLAGKANLTAIDRETGQKSIIWEDSGHQLSMPVLTEELILLRTISGLVGLEKAHIPTLVWKLPLKTWFDLYPLVTNEKIYLSDGNTIQNNGEVIAYDLKERRIKWSWNTGGMLNQPIESGSGKILLQNGSHHIVVLDMESGVVSWSYQFERIYTRPIEYQGHVYCISRKSSESKSFFEYALNVFETSTGKFLKNIVLPGRVLIPPCVYNSTIYLCTHEGTQLGYSAKNFELVFEEIIGNEQDPPKSDLIIENGTLISISRKGRVTATIIENQVPGVILSPETYFLQGDFEQAAACFALQGEFEKAASIYENQIKDAKKAIALYYHAGLFLQAANLSASSGMLIEAESYYQLAGDPINQAQILLRRSLQTKNVIEYANLLRQAIDLFVEAGQEYRELDTLIKLSEVKPENWVFERITKLARAYGSFLVEANAWEYLNKPSEAGPAYIRAAQQAEEKKSTEKSSLIELYQKGANCFANCGQDETETHCRKYISKLKEQAIIQLYEHNTPTIRESNWNYITLEIYNKGYGLARQITWQVNSDKFDVELQTGIWEINALDLNSKKNINLYLRPKPGEVGDAVPLMLEWQWQNTDGTIGTSQKTISISVSRLSRHFSEKLPIEKNTSSGLSFKSAIVKRISPRSKNDQLITVKRRKK